MANTKASESAKKKTALVIVESPSKATTIKGYLGANYRVVASVGHIRDLPKSSLGVDIENGFLPHYINIRGKGDVIKTLKKEAKNAGRIFLATDPDREGEAISWHIAAELGIDKAAACRVTFNEITKGAIKEAIKAPRAIDESLVDAQQARRILDRIVGYKISPLLWKKVKSGLSAGRVQSVATRIITEREEEIRSFIPQEYWTITVYLSTEDGQLLEARFFGNASGKMRLVCEKDALAVKTAIESGAFTVKEIRRTQKPKQPAPPFITSTLQQEAYHKLNFRSQRIMKVAQELYEGINLGSENGGVQGLITYMRTDSLRVSAVAQEAAAALIARTYGEEYLPKAPRSYKSKDSAQDAHEAIRPANVELTPALVRKYLTPDQYRLYKLIWERFIASQMSAAVYDSVSIDFGNNGYIFKTNGYHLQFRGYTAVYDATVEETDEEQNFAHLPTISEKEAMKTDRIEANQHYTEPPLRYTEASLIKFLEENGIGRPSTYTTIITTILNRGYVKREGKALAPTPLGEVTNQLMKENFPKIVDYEFTASMEGELDAIERGEMELNTVLSGFYTDFEKSLTEAQEKVSKEEIVIPPETSPYTCEKCGSPLVYKNGRFGRFLACANYPTCKNTKTIDKDGAPTEKQEKTEPLADFKCELCGGDVVVRNGKFGQFYACSKYPACRFTKQKANPIDALCPDCGARILMRRMRGKMMFYSCERYPDCSFSSWELPTKNKCPECGDILMFHKSKKLLVCRNKACTYKIKAEQEEGRDDGSEN